MKLLLDTQAWILMLQDGLSKRLYKKMEAADTIALSIVSVWEAGIKISKGRLDLGVSLEEAIQATQRSVPLMPILPEHVFALASLGKHHKDPFDRLIIAQAKHEGYAVITGDRVFARYGIKVLW